MLRQLCHCFAVDAATLLMLFAAAADFDDTPPHYAAMPIAAYDAAARYIKTRAHCHICDERAREPIRVC